MAEYKVRKKTREFSPRAKKITGITLIALACVMFFFLLTNLVGFMQDFLLGTFGYFAYPLFIMLFLVGVAFLNNKKYKLSKKYAIFLYLSIFFLLCIIQMAIVGDKNGSFGEYLASNYLKKHTAGGIIIGLFSSSVLYLTSFVWAMVIFCVAFVISMALYIDSILYLRKNKQQEKPVKLAIKETEKPRKTEEVNVVMSGNIEMRENKQESIKQKLGLSRKAYIEPAVTAPQKQPDPRKLEGEELRKYLLTPPEIDVNKYFSENARSYVKNGVTNDAFKRETDRNIQVLKNENPIISDSSPLNVSTAQPEELVSEADDIIREVMQESNFSRSNQVSLDDLQKAETTEQPRLERDRDRNFSSSNIVENKQNSDVNNRTMSERELADRITAGAEGRSFDRQRKFVNLEDDSESKSDDEVEEVKPYNYTRPSINLVTTTSTDMSDLDDDIATKTIILENTLQEFGVPAKVQNVVIGPAVTRYELEMPSGITVKKILNLSSDIALALEANGGDVRIEAPVPGRNVVGIEVPNDKVATVSLRDVLISNEFNSAKSPLTFAVGKDISGNIKVGALNKMPHLLIAGTTGSGKSVMLNNIIISLLYKSSPEDCRMLLIDPKQVEFTPYEGIPHLVVPKVITDVTKAANALQWALDEMERRFRLIREARVKDIDEYNYTADVLNGKKKKMPFIVIIIDEFADFIMQGKKEIEDRIIRLGQKARASGIHMILATQRPTAEFVTGGIKANFPSRIAFKVASRVNSDVILGMTGAEKLLGHGDMLYAPQEYSAAPKRVQGCFITTREIADIVNYVSVNNEPIFDPAVQEAINNMPKNQNAEHGENNGMDPLLPEALKLVIDSGQASTSMIQRRLSLGYPRAGKIIDQMTNMGYISAADGAKPRNVYITLEEFYQIFGDNYD